MMKAVVSCFPLFLPVRTLVVGESPSRRRVRSLLERTEDVEVVGDSGSRAEALCVIRNQAPDLLCVEVQLSDLSGLTLLETIEPERCPQVLLLTEAHHKLQDAFEAHGLDYLRRPFTDTDFYEALRHVCRRVLQDRLGQDRTTHQRVLGALAQLRGQPHFDHHGQVLIPEESGMYHVIRSRDIDWIEAKNGGVRIHVGGDAYWLRQPLAKVESQLDPRVFLRIHRSRIVNRTRITAVKYLWKGEYSVILASGRSLGTGRSYQRVLRRALKTGLLQVEPARDAVGSDVSPSGRSFAMPRNGARPAKRVAR